MIFLWNYWWECFCQLFFFCFFLFCNFNDSVSRYVVCWLCFDFVIVGFVYIYGSKRIVLLGFNDQF